jgi:hypothetical protein
MKALDPVAAWWAREPTSTGGKVFWWLIAGPALAACWMYLADRFVF